MRPPAVAASFGSPGGKSSKNLVCGDCGASKRTIQRLFLNDTKMTFAKWRQQLRLIHAMQLLGSGTKVTTAALESGYGSTSAFISMFRKQLGTTPTRYWAKNGDRSKTTLGRPEPEAHAADS